MSPGPRRKALSWRIVLDSAKTDWFSYADYSLVRVTETAAHQPDVSRHRGLCAAKIADLSYLTSLRRKLIREVGCPAAVMLRMHFHPNSVLPLAQLQCARTAWHP